MAESVKPLKPDANYMNNVVEAVLHGYAPGTDEFHEFLGTPKKPTGFLDTLRIDLFGMSDDEQNAEKRRMFESAVGSHTAAGFADALTKLKATGMAAPSLGDVASGFGGNLPASIVPTANQVQPYAGGMTARVPSVEGPMLAQGLSSLQPSAQELAMLTKRSGEFEPLLQLNPNAPSNIPQLQTLEALRAGHIFDPSSGIIPPSVANKKLELIAEGKKPVIKEVNKGLVQVMPTPEGGVQAVPVPGALPQSGEQPDFSKALEAYTYAQTAADPDGPKSFAQLAKKDPARAKSYEKLVAETRPEERASVIGVKAQERQLSAPIGPDSDNWLDPKTLKPVKATMPKDAVYGQYVHVDNQQKPALSQARTVLESIARIEELGDQLMRKTYGSTWSELPRGVAQSINLKAKKLAGNKEAQEIQSLISRITVPMAKLQGDTANVAVAERQIIAESILADVDTIESLRAKTGSIRNALLGTLSQMGFDSDAFSQSLKKTSPSKQLGNLSAMEAASARAMLKAGRTQAEIEAAILKSRQGRK